MNKIVPGFLMKPGKQHPPVGGNLYHTYRKGISWFRFCAGMSNGMQEVANAFREADCMLPVSSGNRNKNYPEHPVNPV